jgi:hypothetical protein
MQAQPQILRPTSHLEVMANVQPKSRIPIGSKVEIGLKDFTLGIQAEIFFLKIESAPSY